MSTLFHNHRGHEDPDTAASVTATYNRCMYNRGSCMAPRAVKPNDRPHRYCEEHRSRSNAYQKRYVQSRIARRVEHFFITDVDDSLNASVAGSSENVTIYSADEVFESLMQALSVPPLDMVAPPTESTFAVLDNDTDDSVSAIVDTALGRFEYGYFRTALGG